MPTHVILFHHSNKHMFTETHKNTCKTNTDKCMWTCSTIPINPCKTHANTWKLVPLWPQFSWLQCLKNGFPESLLGWSMGSMHLYHIWYIGYCINHKNENAWLGLLIWWSDAARNNSALHTIGIQQSQYWFRTWQSSVENYVGIGTYQKLHFGKAKKAQPI